MPGPEYASKKAAEERRGIRGTGVRPPDPEDAHPEGTFPEGDSRADETTADSEPTRDELYAKAQELEIEGRSSMDKEELAAAIADAESGSDGDDS